ncbi:hypothetical protein CULT_1180013 [[Clostridium] ultunense Esp]|nr:hypothetical protein CULT_1180013 [[Clostridium] ultunense Esp]
MMKRKDMVKAIEEGKMNGKPPKEIVAGQLTMQDKKADDPAKKKLRTNGGNPLDQKEIPVKKNMEIPLSIERLNHEGEGVGRYEGYTLFVPGALPVNQKEIPVKKNMEIPLFIERLNHEGEGVGRYEGYTLFIPGAPRRRGSGQSGESEGYLRVRESAGDHQGEPGATHSALPHLQAVRWLHIATSFL